MKFEIKRLDVYRKVPQDLTEATVTGAIVSLFSISFIVFLFVVELNNYLTTEVISELFVQSEEYQTDRIPVTLNISVFHTLCDVLGLDIQDSNGRHEVGFIENTLKVPINKGKGCRLETQFNINKVPGNFHVSTHSAKYQPENIEMNHHIHLLRFGESVAAFQGAVQTLNNKDSSSPDTKEDTHEYHLKLVPSIYEDGSGKSKHLYQYSYGYKSYVPFSLGRHIPAIWFRYDFTPITIKYTIRPKHFYNFITMIFAFIGGTFTVAGIVYSILFSLSNVFRKLELGKLN